MPSPRELPTRADLGRDVAAIRAALLAGRAASVPDEAELRRLRGDLAMIASYLRSLRASAERL